uniref:Oxysterol-binding protein n=1 Tax=Periophthalmus magnuspinnatus TaxID=409849 RepID=A0A3B3ZHF1_9GOBI
MSINKKTKRIDLDAGDNIYHLKAKSNDIFYIWLTKLCAHRIFKKNEAMSVHRGVLHALSLGQSSLPAMSGPAQPRRSTVTRGHKYSASVYQTEMSSPAPRVAPNLGVNSKVSAWLQQTQDIDATSNELARCQAELTEMAQLIQRLHWLEGGLPITSTDLELRISMQNLTLEKPKKKGRGVGHSRTLSRVEAMVCPIKPILFYPSLECNVVYVQYPTGTLGGNNSSLGNSVPSLPGYLYSQLSKPQVSSPEAQKLHTEICAASQRVHASLCSVHEVLTLERERLRQTPSLHSQRPPSVAESLAEYYDASEVIICESSSEAEQSDESGLSDITTTSTSEPEEGHSAATLNYRDSLNNAPDKRLVRSDTGRRTTLPAHCTDNSHIGVMAILYNNIGKDLSRVSMPVALNEPLCLLQRVSEELEYSELLDTANHIDDPYIRMVYVAAFSISGYAWASWRNRYKPFNPVLGETYESVREDRGFRYVSEQVCHHPPISACHAESENFTFWQDQRWKNKFWGKSLEIISSGPVHVTLPRYNDHYEWNKVVTCIHNVLTQHRTLEHYGEVLITNKNSDVCTCKISFVKVSRVSWFKPRHISVT